MLEEVVIEKLKKLAMLKYDSQPEAVRDFEALSHYFVYIWGPEQLEEEYEWRMVKASTLDMWFEGKFELKERIRLDELYKKKTQYKEEHSCESEKYTPPPPPEHKYIF